MGLGYPPPSRIHCLARARISDGHYHYIRFHSRRSGNDSPGIASPLVTPILKLKLAADSIARQEPIHRIDINQTTNSADWPGYGDNVQKTLDYVERANAASKAKSGFLAIISHECGRR